jgi:hypothetical protein
MKIQLSTKKNKKERGKMKKLYMALLALALAVAAIVPMAIPVAADSPEVVGFVTGSAQGGMGEKPDMILGGTIKLLSDGTIVGNWYWHIFNPEPGESFPEYMANTEWKCDEFYSISFPAVNTVVFTGLLTCINNSQKYKGFSMPFPYTFIITDNGEPGVGQDTWGFPGIISYPVEHGNFQVYYSGTL